MMTGTSKPTINKICFVADKRYQYHNPGLNSFVYLKKYFPNDIFLEEIPDNLQAFIEKNRINVLILFIVPTIIPTIRDLKKISEKIQIGIYFDDTLQYFSNWFKYLTQVIDFAICWEPTDVHLFESYGVTSSHLPLFATTYVQEFNNVNLIEYKERPINFLHIGRMDRPGRNDAMASVQKNIEKNEFWGEGTKNGYIDSNNYVQKIINSKITFNNSSCAQYEYVTKSDRIELARRQFKGKIFHYLLGQTLLITEDAPLLENYLKNEEEIVIIGKNDNLINLVKKYLSNPERSMYIANNGRNRVLGYLNEELNIENLKLLIEKSFIVKERRKKPEIILVNKFYVRSIIAIDGDFLFENPKYLNKFIKEYKKYLFDYYLVYLLLRKLIKKLYKYLINIIKI